MRTVVVACLLLVAFAGCGRERPSAEPASETTAEDPLGSFEQAALKGRIRADGSSTVAPFMTLAAERFRREEPGVKVTVGTSGTGGGFERFCRGETDLSNASRPVKPEEEEICAENNVEFFELQVANDGIAVVLNRENDWAQCLTVEQLKRMWEPGSDVDSWRDVDPEFPDSDLELFGAGTDSGTFDYFTDAIVGEEGASRSDYTPSEDDNVTVRGVSGSEGALGYFGLSYFLENEELLRAAEIDGGDGCVAPSVETVQSGEYKPLSRALFTYVNVASLDDKPALDAFLGFVVDNEAEIARGAKFVPMTAEQLDRARNVLESGGFGSEE